MESFKIKAFSRETGFKIGDHWEGGLPTDVPTSGYHAHFKGHASKEWARLSIEFYDSVLKRRPDDAPPSAETIMKFVGSFVREPRYRAVVHATFENQDTEWTSRFNLPFKVTMDGEEVVIDGVSLNLPKNRFGATNGWVTKLKKSVVASVDLIRVIEFSSFQLDNELEVLDGSVKIFVEQTKTT